MSDLEERILLNFLVLDHLKKVTPGIAKEFEVWQDGIISSVVNVDNSPPESPPSSQSGGSN